MHLFKNKFKIRIQFVLDIGPSEKVLIFQHSWYNRFSVLFLIKHLYCSVGNKNLSLVAVTWAEAVIRCNIVLTSSFEGYYETPTQSPTLAWTGISRRSHLYWGQGQKR